MRLDETVKALHQVRLWRLRLKALDAAMETLSECERAIIESLVIAPQRGNADKMCEMFDIEPAAVYRRRNKALKKLGELLGSWESA